MKRDLFARLCLTAALCAGCAAAPPAQTGEAKPDGTVNLGGGSVSASGASTSADGCPTGCTTPPPGCVIKGNINIRTGKKIYHVPGGEHYNDVTIETEAGERWFCTEDEAEENGWRRAKK